MVDTEDWLEVIDTRGHGSHPPEGTSHTHTHTHKRAGVCIEDWIEVVTRRGRHSHTQLEFAVSLHHEQCTSVLVLVVFQSCGIKSIITLSFSRTAVHVKARFNSQPLCTLFEHNPVNTQSKRFVRQTLAQLPQLHN